MVLFFDRAERADVSEVDLFVLLGFCFCLLLLLLLAACSGTGMGRGSSSGFFSNKGINEPTGFLDSEAEDRLGFSFFCSLSFWSLSSSTAWLSLLRPLSTHQTFLRL